MEWDPELLATLRKLREDASRRRKERTASSRTPNPTITPEIKMVVTEWYTDEIGNRARMIYNAKTADFETPYDLSRGFSLA
jgi:hypothetical protein